MPRPFKGFCDPAFADGYLQALEDLFPPHKCGAYLTHNAYKDYYESIESAVADMGDGWVSPEEREKALATGEIWEMQWYPNTPVGFYKKVASSLQALMESNEDA